MGWVNHLASRLHDDAECSVFGVFPYDSRSHCTDDGSIHVRSESNEPIHGIAHDNLRSDHANSRRRNADWSVQCYDAMVVTLWRSDASARVSDALQWLDYA